MRHLQHDAGTIAGVVLAATGAPMLHIFQNGQRIGNNLVRFVTLDIGYKPNTAGIVFKQGRIQSIVACHHSFIYTLRKASIAKASNLSENNKKCIVNGPVWPLVFERHFFGGHKIFPCKPNRDKGLHPIMGLWVNIGWINYVPVSLRVVERGQLI
jgi:hypothetical protein